MGEPFEDFTIRPKLWIIKLEGKSSCCILVHVEGGKIMYKKPQRNVITIDILNLPHVHALSFSANLSLSFMQINN